ncbi:heme biosynthesis protein HemY [Telmatospirillum sp. J64-1]|uniref:heme biosynthesis protein HemY n=1 Tax=Telmatospirillum sp. J64-1 TaxID=2502183 RepID=UPI00115DF3CC|nr:heme biosynthesis HemY N-terminal domain-containing protein [Telmatospirillum sp. J64-1]
MIRLILYVLVVAVLVVVSVWMAERPGQVSVRWLGWQIETTVPVLLLALALLLGVVWLVLKFLGILLHLPRDLRRARRESRYRKGIVALTSGMAAVAAGDSHQARRMARRADDLLKDASITRLLSAQAAEIAGDREAAKRHYTEMVDDPDSRFLGLRGLLEISLKEGDRTAALDYARRAHAMNPEAGWLAKTLFELEAGAGNWRDAEVGLNAAIRAGEIDETQGRHMRSILLQERARQMLLDKDTGRAVKLARQAQNADASSVPAVLTLAEALKAAGKQAKAARAIEEAWSRSPHPDLASAYLALFAGEDELQRVRHAETLCRQRPDDPESHLVVGEVALSAKLWGQARNHLMKAIENRPSRRAHRLLAKLEEQEKGDKAAAQKWLELAAAEPPDPVWLCHSCGTATQRWAATCPKCNALDSISWSQPASRANALPATTTPSPEVKAAS